MALGRIKNDSEFIERIFAAKAAREIPQEVEAPQVAAVEEPFSIPLTEEIRKPDVIEKIISEAEEAAFKKTL